MNEKAPSQENPPYFDETIAHLIDGIEVGEQDQPLKELVKKLTFEALQEIEQKYGKDGEGAKPFHDAAHTKEFIIDVSRAFEAAKERFPDFNLSGRDQLLLILASAYHDIEQTLGPEKNEQASADILMKEILEQTIISEDEKKLLDRLIMVTVFDFPNHRQLLSNLQTTQTKQDALERCMALADLAALGDFPRQHWRGNRLAHELNLTDNPQQWFAKQIAFITKQKEYLQTVFQDFPWQVIYPDIDKNLALYQNLAKHYQQLIDNGISPQKIMAKDKLTSDRVKTALVKEALDNAV